MFRAHSLLSLIAIAWAASICASVGSQHAVASEQIRWTTFPIKYGTNGRSIKAQSEDGADRLDAWISIPHPKKHETLQFRRSLGLSCRFGKDAKQLKTTEYRLRIILEEPDVTVSRPEFLASTETCGARSLGEFGWSIGAWHGQIDRKMLRCLSRDHSLKITSPETEKEFSFTLSGSAQAIQRMKCQEWK